jgi:hypothetical protein
MVALLGVCIAARKTQHEEMSGEIVFADAGEALVWVAINAAHRMLTTA